MFAVVVFINDGTHEYLERDLPAKSAVKLARFISLHPAPDIDAVIIVDEDDYTTFRWERGKGVVFPPPVGVVK